MSREGISVDPQKIEDITQWPRHNNAIEVRSLLRLVGCYRRFVQNFSKVATALTSLTRKTTNYQ